MYIIYPYITRPKKNSVLKHTSANTTACSGCYLFNMQTCFLMFSLDGVKISWIRHQGWESLGGLDLSQVYSHCHPTAPFKIKSEQGHFLSCEVTPLQQVKMSCPFKACHGSMGNKRGYCQCACGSEFSLNTPLLLCPICNQGRKGGRKCERAG